MDPEPTNKEILAAVNKLGTHIENTDKQVGDILEVVNAFSTKIDGRMDKLDGRMDKLDGHMEKLEKDVGYLRSNMATKDYIDEALAKQKGEIILTMRKEDVKLRELIAIMHGKQMLTDTEVKHLITMEPFAQLSV